MGKLSYISINDKCEVVLEGEIYKSNIQEITEKYIAISLPVFNGAYAVLHKGDMIEIWCYHDNKIYSFVSHVIGRRKEKIRMILISKPDNESIKKVQRRRNFRVDIIQSIKYKIINNGNVKGEVEKIKNNSDELLDGFMLDLSGGGLKIRIKEKVNIGDKIFINLPIENEKVFLVSTCVRAVKEVSGEYICGLEFYDIDKKVKEHLIAYTFNIMRMRMKKDIK